MLACGEKNQLFPLVAFGSEPRNEQSHRDVKSQKEKAHLLWRDAGGNHRLHGEIASRRQGFDGTRPGPISGNEWTGDRLDLLGQSENSAR